MGDKIAFLALGAFNCSMMAKIDRQSNGQREIEFWDIDQEVMEHFEKHHVHPYHFQDIAFSDNVHPADSISGLLNGAGNLIVGVNAQSMRKAARTFGEYLSKDTIITSLSKGLELETGKRMSEVIREELDCALVYDPKITVFSGGTVAQDIAYGRPVMAHVAGDDPITIDEVAELFHSTAVRVVPTTEMLSVEYCGALKNVVSIGGGICEELYPGAEGTKAAFKIRTEFDIYKIAKALGASDDIFLPGSPSFYGDSDLSCYGPTRNREYGQRIGCGQDPKAALKEMEQAHKTVEGYYTLKVAYELSQKLGLDTPCIEQLFQVVHDGLSPERAVKNLMSRPRTSLNP
ncbi:MAG: hypothetical protein KJ709_09355 [Nanoarchaeota archaeon]|nr:hypothetical protein [Nanoarchaeota archaeon]